MSNEIIYAVSAFVVGGGLGAFIIWIRLNKKVQVTNQILLQKESELQSEKYGHSIDKQTNERLLSERERANRQLLEEKEAATRKLIESKDREFAVMVKTLEEKFANLAAVTLEAKSKDLTNASRVSLDAAIKPLTEQMTKFQEATQRAQNDNRDLSNAIHKDIESIGKYAKDLSEFSVAIKSGNTVQGRSGEDVLAEKLKQAGLEEGVTFFLQEGTGHDRPDAQICDAENRWLIIDSKVSLTAYVDYRNGQLDEETRKQRLKDHVESVRRRIISLRDKKYPKVLAEKYPERNYLPLAAMFVPYESALSAALEADPSLWQLALQGNVVLLTPMTLIAYCRLVYLAWQNKKLEQEYKDVLKDAQELLTRMNNFALAFESVGSSLDGAKAEYENAKKVLIDSKGGHTIGNSARKMIKAGVELVNKKGENKLIAECLKAI